MPNTTVPAAAEGVPEIRDPLLETIRAYRRGLADFELNHPRDDDAGTDAYADRSYGAPLARLQQWRGPATSLEGAIEALRLCATDDFAIRGTDAVDKMVAAALSFLEKEGPGMRVDKKKSLDAEDLVYECAHLSQLVFMAIEGLELDAEVSALSAGIWVIRRKLLDAAHLMDLAKQASR